METNETPVTEVTDKPVIAERPATEVKADKPAATMKLERPMAETKHERPAEKKRHMDDNVIYVGKKGVMNYVMAAITQLSKGEKEIHVKARGRSISKAVDIVQLLKNRFETAAKIKGIEIGTEEVKAEEGGMIKVSTIDIVVTK
jgi:DNA-binding protein